MRDGDPVPNFPLPIEPLEEPRRDGGTISPNAQGGSQLTQKVLVLSMTWVQTFAKIGKALFKMF